MSGCFVYEKKAKQNKPKVREQRMTDGVVREGFWRRQHLSRYLNEVKVRGMVISGGESVQGRGRNTSEGSEAAEQAWPIPGALRGDVAGSRVKGKEVAAEDA